MTPTAREQYDELLLAVVNKYEGETRHQTALRYIREREQNQGGAAAQETPRGESK